MKKSKPSPAKQPRLVEFFIASTLVGDVRGRFAEWVIISRRYANMIIK